MSFRLGRFCRARDGAAAVELALVMPILFALIFGALAVCTMAALINGLEQICGEAARSSVAGTTDAERTALATAYVSSHLGAYPYLDASALTLTTSGNPTTKTFKVSVTYDVSRNQLLALARRLAPFTPNNVSRSSVVLEGGN